MKKFSQIRADNKKQAVKKLYKNAPSLPTSMGRHSLPKNDKKKPVNENEYNYLHDEKSKVTDPNQIEAIKDYTTASYNINQPLHEGEEVPDFKKKTLRHLNDMFDDKTTHVGEEHIVYTGLNGTGVRLFNQIEPDSKGFRRVKQKAFTSTSTDKDVATDFTTKDDNGTRHVLRIKVPADHPSVNISHHSHFYTDPEKPHLESEREILLDRGTLLKIHPTPHHDTMNNIMYHTAEVEGHDKE